MDTTKTLPDHKQRTIAEADALINSRLFGDGPWIPDRRARLAILRWLVEVGIDQVDEQGNSIGGVLSGELAREGLPIGLLNVFLGVHEPVEMPSLLRDAGLIDDEEEDWLFKAVNAAVVGYDFHDSVAYLAAAERFLRPVVQEAYRNVTARPARLA